MKNKEETLFTWLGLRRNFDFTKLRPLGLTVGIILVSLGSIILVLTTAQFLKLLIGAADFVEKVDRDASIRNTGLVFVALLGIPFVIWRSIVAQKQVDVAEQNQITDRINKAVEGLGAEKTRTYRGRHVYWYDTEHGVDHRVGFTQRWGESTDVKDRLPEETKSLTEAEIDRIVKFDAWTDISETVPNLEVRIGAIYALERISQDSDRDYERIIEILCAYIRHNAPASSAVPLPKSWQDSFNGDKKIEIENEQHLNELIKKWAHKVPSPRADVQAALSVIGRRTSTDKKTSHDGYSLDLSKSNLQGANLESADLSRANLKKTHLQGANLISANLKRSNLHKAKCQAALLSNSRLKRAILVKANFQATDLVHSRLEKANLEKTQVQGAKLRGARLQGA